MLGIKDKIIERIISVNNKKQQSKETADTIMESYYNGKIDTYKEILKLMEALNI